MKKGLELVFVNPAGLGIIENGTKMTTAVVNLVGRILLKASKGKRQQDKRGSSRYVLFPGCETRHPARTTWDMGTFCVYVLCPLNIRPHLQILQSY